MTTSWERPMGAEQEFREFVTGRSRALQRTAWLLTGDWATAEDLVQTALAKTWLRWSKIRNQETLDLYVRKAIVNTYATWWRRRWRGEIPTKDFPERESHDNAYDRTDLRLALVAALADLPRRQRAVVVLRYFDDLTEAQVAEVLGCSVGTVKSQAYRAFEKLRHAPQLIDLIPEEVAR